MQPGQTLSEMVAGLRSSRGLSQEQLAERSGISVRAIGEIERGATRRPHRETLRALAGALNLTPDEQEAFARSARTAPPPDTRGRRSVRPALPAPVTSIVGRADDLAAVLRLVRNPAVRLVTITGTGGVGKTRLALEAGWQAASRFEAVHGLDLSALREADDVPQALAESLRTPDPATAIGDGRWLLVLDSFEHVAAAATTVAALLAGCPRLTVLVTSRAPLRLRGEHLWPLTPLSTPDSDDPAAMAGHAAVELLVERTAAVRPGFALTGDNAAAVAALCRRLDGLPLALELAAARLRTQAPSQVLAQVRDLHGDTVDLADRHLSLRRTVEWSTRGLTEPDRRLFGLLGAFAGGADPADVEAVFGGRPHALATLAAHSLVTVTDRAGHPRIGMLDTIREVVEDQLTGAADRDGHAEHFFRLVRDGDPRLGDEQDNVRAAIQHAVDAAPALLQVATVRALTGHYVARGRFAEGRRMLAGAAGAAPTEQARAWAWHGAAVTANQSGDPEAALALAASAAEAFGADPDGRAATLTLIGNAHKFAGRYADAAAAYTDVLEQARSTGDARRETIALNNLGALAHDRGAYAEAIEYHAAALRRKYELGDRRGVAVAQLNLGAVRNDTGDHAGAAVLLTEAAATFAALGEPGSEAFALALLAQSHAGLARWDDATATGKRALDLARRAEHAQATGLALLALGETAAANGDPGSDALLREALTFPIGLPDQARIRKHLGGR
ncbi:tetratricopeptide repeat protein [Amycolatopsis sp., V23-08]|uniref:Tetratricopeptide repeat protein n=1 Tax=Amycolatopsis heterodermiae TaxID=3110235 RepID=A0ABU5RJ44_9PSEU|nr:helix-turn-helix domain-containing protein [Amycolatopsis sp., V23-08]MEA5366317.1 tetratricopeptide repeat protein [Amycolatopsis sp., V23-08]